MKTMTIDQFLTDIQIKACLALYRANQATAVKNIKEGIIEPNIGLINAKLGQENDPTYLAYAIYYALSRQQNPS